MDFKGYGYIAGAMAGVIIEKTMVAIIFSLFDNSLVATLVGLGVVIVFILLLPHIMRFISEHF